jgi:hypothetical protein
MQPFLFLLIQSDGKRKTQLTKRGLSDQLHPHHANLGREPNTHFPHEVFHARSGRCAPVTDCDSSFSTKYKEKTQRKIKLTTGLYSNNTTQLENRISGNAKNRKRSFSSCRVLIGFFRGCPGLATYWHTTILSKNLHYTIKNPHISYLPHLATTIISFLLDPSIDKKNTSSIYRFLRMTDPHVVVVISDDEEDEQQ